MKEGLGLEFSGSLDDGLHETFVISFSHESFTTGYRGDWEKEHSKWQQNMFWIGEGI